MELLLLPFILIQIVLYSFSELVGAVLDIFSRYPLLIGGAILFVLIIGGLQVGKEARQQRTNRDVDDLLSRYCPISLLAQEPTVFPAKKELLNAEIISAVMIYKQEIKSAIDDCEALDIQIQKILCFDQNFSAAQKLRYIRSHVSELNRLKEKRDHIYAPIKRKQIRLLHEDGECMEKLQQAFATLLQSKKANGTTGNKPAKIYCREKMDSFTFFEKPKDLSIFEFKYDPVILFYDEFYYCLFSNVILVFDRNGIFSTALDPSALRIDAKQQETKVIVFGRDRLGAGHYIVDDDSKLVRLDVDFRRSEYISLTKEFVQKRTHLCAYTSLKITIADKAFGFNMSACSDAICDSFNKASTHYIRKCNDRHDPIPALMMLLKILSDSGDVVSDSLLHEYEAQATGYFCKIVSI